MPRTTTVTLLIAGQLLAVAAGAQWLPRDARERWAQQFSVRLRTIVPDDKSDQEVLDAARIAIEELVAVLDRWGLQGTIERAPELPEIALPRTNDPFLRAMAAWSACSLPLHDELAADESERFYVVVGEFVVMGIGVFLRSGFLAAGGTDQAIRDYLESAEMNLISLEIQRSAELRGYVNAQCVAPMAELMG